MKDEQGDRDFLDQVKHRLDDSADQIDELTLARLGAARRRAVEAGSRRHSTWRLGDVLIAGRSGRFAWLVGGVFLLLVLVTWHLQTPATPQTLLLDDMELLSAAEELEFYQELEFFIWAADEQDEG